MAPKSYYHLWSSIFGLNEIDFENATPRIVSTGRYIEKHQDKYAFFFTDLTSGKKIFAASRKNLARLGGAVNESDLQNFEWESVKNLPWSKDLPVAFADLDYGFVDAKNFRTVAADNLKNRGCKLSNLTPSETSRIEEFYRDCSEDDRDTLDLTFENEFALAVMKDDVPQAIARSLDVRDSNICDITVVVRNSARGNSLSAPLVSKLVERILGSGRLPKYRVAETNSPSIKVAERLGFNLMFSLIAWEMKK